MHAGPPPPSRLGNLRRTIAAVGLFALWLPIRAASAQQAAADPVAGYLRALEQSGRLRPESATRERLGELLIEAEGHLIAADALAATTILFGVVESPRFAPLKDTPSFANAEFLLGRALAAGRAYRSAERYLGRAIARGPKNPYFVPAFRALTDMALDTGSQARLLPVLEAAAKAPDLPADSGHELAYMRGRVAYGAGIFDEADAQFSQVGKTSRLYPAALYFRGLVAVQEKNYNDARDAFCSIADQRDQDRVTFNVDSRFFRLKDLARLALGRIAHEQDHFDESYYFYFAIPDDSPRLPAALFEAAWSMLQKGEFAAARAFAEQFDRMFPESPLRPEVAIMRTNLAVKTCQFDRARSEATALEKKYQPLRELASRAGKDAALRNRIIDRLIAGTQGAGSSSDREGDLIRILILDQGFNDLVSGIADLGVDLAEATRAVKLWRVLGHKVTSAKQDMPAASSPEAVRLLEDALALSEHAGHDPDLQRRIGDLVLQASLAAYPPEQAGPYAAEARAAEDLAARLSALRGEMIKEARAIAGAALVDAERRLVAVLGQTRLVHIDAVVGKKKKLEIEISGLGQGKLDKDSYFKLAAEGTIADDEIYWPFEGEFWADEYENFR